MAIGDDFNVALNGDIRHVSGSTNYTVLELHRWLMNLADDQQATASDFVDITTYTPSERATDQIIELKDYSGLATPGPTFNIDATAAQYLYDGSVSQRGGDDLYSGLVVVGSVQANTELQVIQDEVKLASHWGTGKNAVPAANILLQILIKSRSDGADIDGKRVRVIARELSDTYAEFSATLGQANSTAAIFTSDDLNNQTGAGTISGWTITNTEGYQEYDITGEGTVEPYYSKWDKGTQSNNDLYEYTKWIQRRDSGSGDLSSETIHGINGLYFRGITHEVVYDGEAGTGPVEDNYLAWGTTFAYDAELASGLTVGEYYTFQTSGAVGKLLALDDDGTTGSVVFAIEPGSGTVTNGESFVRSDGTATDGADVNSVPADTSATGGRGLVLADDTTNTLWIQLLSGGAPQDNVPMYNTTTAGVYDVANYCIPNVTITARTVVPEFIGQSTGTNIIGPFGLGVEPTEAVVGDKYTDLDNQLRQPPNNVDFDVGGLVSGEDRVLATWKDPAQLGIEFDQLTLNGAKNTSGQTTVVVNETIPSDTPDSGTIRVELENGIYRYVAFTSWTGPSTFNTASTDWSDPNDALDNADVFISYLDKLAGAATETFTVTYNQDRTIFVRVRDGGTAGDAKGIKTFETSGTLGSGGGGVTAIRTSDA